MNVGPEDLHAGEPPRRYIPNLPAVNMASELLSKGMEYLRLPGAVRPDESQHTSREAEPLRLAIEELGEVYTEFYGEAHRTSRRRYPMTVAAACHHADVLLQRGRRSLFGESAVYEMPSSKKATRVE
jgi:hypothetical protein